MLRRIEVNSGLDTDSKATERGLKHRATPESVATIRVIIFP
jgi:hypothetical protein